MMTKKYLEKEQRLNDELEFRAEENEQGKMILEGYAAVFNQETLIGMNEEDGFYEVIDPHAFDETDMKDCCFKYNHGDAKGILARVKNGSLKITIDDVGLKFRAELIDTSDNVDIYKSVKSKLLDKCSFAFTVLEDKVSMRGQAVIRRITKIGRLFDCSVVDIPAYDQTSIYARSKEIVGERLRNLQPSLENDEVDLEKSKREMELEKIKIEVLYGKEI